MGQGSESLTSFEICAGAGGQALGLEQAGFEHEFLIEWEKAAVDTLRMNRPNWEVHHGDLREYVKSGEAEERFRGKIDLLAGGVPCPPFSYAGKQLGKEDDRDLFPDAIKLADQLRPRAIMIENVRGLALSKFLPYRQEILGLLSDIKDEDTGKPLYAFCGWQVLYAEEFGVPQQRPRSILVAMQRPYAEYWEWPHRTGHSTVNLGDLLAESMEKRGLSGDKYEYWYKKASQKSAGPTLVGGSKKHGGADLGPTRAKKAWAELGVNALGVADDTEPHKLTDAKRERELESNLGPMLTVRQAAMIQGFPDEWGFSGRKTAAYRQVGNAFPPPVARAVGTSIARALRKIGKPAEGGAGAVHPAGTSTGAEPPRQYRPIQELAPAELW